MLLWIDDFWLMFTLFKTVTCCVGVVEYVNLIVRTNMVEVVKEQMFHLICSYRYYTVMISPITDILHTKVKSTLGSNLVFWRNGLHCYGMLIRKKICYGMLRMHDCKFVTSLLQKGPVSGLYSSNLIEETHCVTLISSWLMKWWIICTIYDHTKYWCFSIVYLLCPLCCHSSY